MAARKGLAHADRCDGEESGIWHVKVMADLACEMVVEFAMARNRGGLARGPVHVDRMGATLPE